MLGSVKPLFETADIWLSGAGAGAGARSEAAWRTGTRTGKCTVAQPNHDSPLDGA